MTDILKSVLDSKSAAALAEANMHSFQLTPGDDENTYIDQIKRGYESPVRRPAAMLATGIERIIKVPPDGSYLPSALEYKLYEKQSEYHAIKKLRGNANGRYGIFSGRASASQRREQHSSSYDLHVVLSVQKFDMIKVLDKDTAKTAPEALAWKRQYGSSRASIRFGDGYVSGAATGSDLFVDLRISTSSSETRNKIKGSVNAKLAGFGGGGGKISEIIKSAEGSRSVTLSINNVKPGDYETILTADMKTIIDRYLLDPERAQRIAALYVRPVLDLGEDWIDNRALVKRERFAAEVERQIDLLDAAMVDVEYVRSNREEFATSLQAKAGQDADLIEGRIATITRVAQDMYADYLDGRRATFDITALGTPLSLEPYNQITP